MPLGFARGTSYQSCSSSAPAISSIRRTSRAILDSRSEPHLMSRHLAQPAPPLSSARRLARLEQVGHRNMTSYPIEVAWLTFKIREPRSPLECGVSSDDRRLGLGLIS